MLEDQTRKRAELLERDRREIAQRAEAQLANALRTFTAELDLRAAARGERTRGARVTRGQSELLARTIEEVRASLGIDAQRAEPRAAPSAALAPGDRVRILSLESDGTVVEVLDHDVMVQLGALRMSVPRSDVRRRGGPAPRIERDEHASGAARLAAATAARAELDVRGKRFVEAQPLVERWIDESVLADASPLRLIHGKGTGLLGRGLQQYLREHPRVRDVRFGGPDEGGSGVTVFELA
jgi:DNA mismatch repair protein MutS2